MTTYFLFNAILFMCSSPVHINVILTMLHHKLIQLLDTFQLSHKTSSFNEIQTKLVMLESIKSYRFESSPGERRPLLWLMYDERRHCRCHFSLPHTIQNRFR